MSPDWLWLLGCIRFLDVELQDLIKEGFLVSRQSNGGITLKDICDMNMKDYLFTINYADALQKRTETAQSE